MDAASGDATLESAIDALYAGALADFVPARNRLAQALKDRDKDAAAAIKALGKPSLSAWAVNQLWWHARPEVDTLLAAGQLVRRLQQSGAGPAEQQRAAKRRRACLDALLRAAQTRLTEGGHASGATTLRKVRTTLEALAAWGDDVPAPGPGRLVDDLEAPGFEALGALAFSAPSLDTSGSLEPRPDDSVIELTQRVTPDDRRQQQRRAAADALRQAQRIVDEATRQVDAAEAAADDAAAAADAAQQAYRRARAEAEAAMRRAEHAQTSWRRDGKQAEALAEAANRARATLREAEAEVQRLSAALDEP